MTLHRRSFLRHVASAGLGLGAAAAAPGFVSQLRGTPRGDRPLQVCLLSGSQEYQSNETLATFQETLERDYPAKCSRAFWASSDNLPGLEALETCDVMLLFTKRLKIDGEQLERVKKYCLAGRPIVGVRTASHAFQNWLELDHLILGGDYKGHYSSGPITQLTFAENASAHPVLKDVKPFESPTKLYKNPQLAKDTELLLNGSIPDHTEPLAWTHKFRDARIFYTSLGGPEDFANGNFRQLLVNALFWTAKRS